MPLWVKFFGAKPNMDNGRTVISIYVPSCEKDVLDRLEKLKHLRLRSKYLVELVKMDLAKGILFTNEDMATIEDDDARIVQFKY